MPRLGLLFDPLASLQVQPIKAIFLRHCVFFISLPVKAQIMAFSIYELDYTVGFEFIRTLCVLVLLCVRSVGGSEQKYTVYEKT